MQCLTLLFISLDHPPAAGYHAKKFGLDAYSTYPGLALLTGMLCYDLGLQQKLHVTAAAASLLPQSATNCVILDLLEKLHFHRKL